MGLTSGGGVQYDQNNNIQTQLAQQQSLSDTSNQKSSAGISNQYAQGQVNQGRDSLQAQVGLNKQASDLQRSQLNQSQSNLGTNQSLSNQGIGLSRQANKIDQASALLSKYELDINRQNDVFSRGLLPDLRSQQLLAEADQARVQSLFGVNLQQTGEDFGRNVQSSVQDTQYGLDRQAYQSGLEEIPTNAAYQRKAEDSAYLSSLGSSNTQAQAALASLASSQFGTLSTIGNNLTNGTQAGFSQRSNGAANIASALNSVGGFMSNLQGYLATRNTGK
jgi:hypothetical protein